MCTAEAEYISASSCCTQLLWMKHQLEDYQINANNIPIYCDNTAAICLSKNPIMHSRAKHTEIKHILLEIMFKKEFWIYNSLILNINGLIYSLNL